MTVFYIVTIGLVVFIAVLFANLKYTIRTVTKLAQLLANTESYVNDLEQRIEALEEAQKIR